MNKGYLFVFPSAVLGGAERVMFNLIHYKLKENHKVTVLIMTRGKQPGWESILNHPNLTLIVKDYKSEKSSLPNVLLNLIYLSRKNSYNYTFSSHTHVNGMLSFMRKLKLLKTEYLIARESTFIFERYHGLWRTIFKFIYRFMYGKQDLLICQTENMKSSLIHSLGFKPNDKIEVVPNPVNLDYIQKQISNSDLIVKPFDILIVGCGRLITLKKFDLLIEAFANLTHQFPQAGIVIIGDGPEGDNLNNLVQNLGLESKVIFTGKISNPIQWFNNADIGIICSEIEGFPNVLIEMMASGTKQVITTPCTDGVNHIPYITVAKSCSLQAIEDSLKTNLVGLTNNSKNNREYIEENRSVEVFWKKVVQYLE